MRIEQKLYQEAVALIRQRYPMGWGGAAALCTEEGTILTSVAPEVINASTELCIETGAICEAHKLNEAVTHIICVVRDDEKSDFKVLTPCGICQERLLYWGPKVKAAVYTSDGELLFKALEELQPYHCYRAYDKSHFQPHRCPICKKDNNCGNLLQEEQYTPCWCTKVRFPSGIFDLIPPEQRGKACICKECVERFVNGEM